MTEAFSVSPEESAAQAPYRWGGNDPDAASMASAEVIGKNLVGKKAQYAGGALKGTTRKLGLVLIKDNIDESLFEKTLGKYKGTIVNTQTYVGSGGALGDATVAQEQAPVMVTKMKDAGVTTVVLFTDVAMNKALMQQATAQEWFPEWFVTGAGYFDLPVLAQAYPAEQAEHTFGISLIPPYFKLPDEVTNITGSIGAFNWYFGSGGTTSGAVPGGIDWFLNGIHNAGPNLTPQTLEQGLFAVPPTANPTHSPLVVLTGYGRTTGLPYDAVQPGAGRLRADVDGSAHERHLRRERDGGSRGFVVHGRRPSLQQRDLAEEPGLVRQVHLDRPDRLASTWGHPPRGGAPMRGGEVSVDGRGRADAGYAQPIRIRRQGIARRLRDIVRRSALRDDYPDASEVLDPRVSRVGITVSLGCDAQRGEVGAGLVIGVGRAESH